jgi:hypothetical protein
MLHRATLVLCISLLNVGYAIPTHARITRIVFEGLMPLISGSRLMSINAPFGMPSRSPGHYGGDQFPHTYAITEGPISKKRDG